MYTQVTTLFWNNCSFYEHWQDLNTIFSLFHLEICPGGDLDANTSSSFNSRAFIVRSVSSSLKKYLEQFFKASFQLNRLYADVEIF